mgnify:FL=1
MIDICQYTDALKNKAFKKCSGYKNTDSGKMYRLTSKSVWLISEE